MAPRIPGRAWQTPRLPTSEHDPEAEATPLPFEGLDFVYMPRGTTWRLQPRPDPQRLVGGAHPTTHKYPRRTGVLEN